MTTYDIFTLFKHNILPVSHILQVLYSYTNTCPILVLISEKYLHFYKLQSVYDDTNAAIPPDDKHQIRSENVRFLQWVCIKLELHKPSL